LKDKLKNVFKFLLFLSLGVLLMYLAYQGADFTEIKNVIGEANFFWVGVSLFLGIISNVSRAMRWNILIKPLGYQPRLANTFFAVMIMYLANLAIPRLGEVSRCGVLTKYEKVPFTKLLGTVFLERVVDLIMLLVLFAFVLVAQFHVVVQFIADNPEISSKLNWLLESKIFLGSIFFGSLFLFFIFWKLRNKISHFVLYKKIKELVINFVEGLKTIKHMEQKWAFIGHTVFIFTLYFLMIYVVFFAFDFTSHIDVLTGLTIFVISCFGMVAPVQGGVGAWHFMVMKAMVIYGIAEKPYGQAFAFLAHSTMTLMVLVVGFLTLIALPIYNRRIEKQNTVAAN